METKPKTNADRIRAMTDKELAPLPGGGWREMKVLIVCEESQTGCKAFRAKGHEAYSCGTSRNKGNRDKAGISRKGGASKARSKSSPGIAAAMAEQWGGLPCE